MKNTKQLSFKKGDRVTWTSQASGFSKKKTGNVVRVLRPFFYASRGCFSKRTDFLRAPMCRDHRSYIIRDEKSGKLYWPLVKNLKLVGGR